MAEVHRSGAIHKAITDHPGTASMSVFKAGYVCWLCLLVMSAGYVCWLCLLVMSAGCVFWLCLLVVSAGYVCWLCLLVMSAGYVLYNVLQLSTDRYVEYTPEIAQLLHRLKNDNKLFLVTNSPFWFVYVH